MRNNTLRAVLIATAASLPAAGWELFASFSQGYTSYRAEDLNRVLVLMEKTTKESGFNPYKVSRFDGHPQNAVVAGVRAGAWSLGVEAEFWVERFEQSEVPFDLEDASRNNRITCATLRDPAYQAKGLSGCVEAHETFNFLPITLQAAYSRELAPWFRFGGGYGAGVLAGSAYIDMTAKYYGAGAIPDDQVRFRVWPGVNLVQKAFMDAEVLPWPKVARPWPVVGLALRGGWRFSGVNALTLKDQEGSSRIFSSVFPESREGAHLYIRSFTANPSDDRLYLGTEADAKRLVAADGSRFHLVNGDFNGWFAALKLNVYWRDL